MLTLNKRIREVVGPCRTETGRGMTWLVAGWGKASDNKVVLEKLKATFETWKLVREYDDGMVFNDYLFIVVSKRGKLLGFCQMNDWDESHGERNLIINTFERTDLEEFHNHNKSYIERKEYKKVTYEKVT